MALFEAVKLNLMLVGLSFKMTMHIMDMNTPTLSSIMNKNLTCNGCI